MTLDAEDQVGFLGGHGLIWCSHPVLLEEASTLSGPLGKEL
jgi:hypothetical protein